MTVREMEVEEAGAASGNGDSGLRDRILDHLSLNDEAHFKSQQLNEPDLTPEEKRQIASDVLGRNPGCFLSRFGKFLTEEHLDYFTDLASENYEVNYYLSDLRKNFQRTFSKTVVRNRRLEALRRLTEHSEYFSDEEMRKRNPAMYEHLVGQYLTEEEKAGMKYERLQAKSFSSIILNAVDENEIEEKLKEDKVVDEDAATDSDSGMSDISASSGISLSDTYKPWGEFTTNEPEPQTSSKALTKKRKKKKTKNEEPPTDEERAIMMNEFRSRMFEEFLGGKDSEFDYTKVDANNDYDDLEMLENDQQDKYFDSELPEEVMSRGEESSDSSISSNIPPPRSLEDRMANLET